MTTRGDGGDAVPPHSNKGGMRSVLKRIRSRRGDFTINGAFILVLVCALLALGITVLGTALQSNKLSVMTADLVRSIELRGQADAAVYTELQRLAENAGLEVSMDLEADYLPGTRRIQFGDAFTVTLSCQMEIGIGGVLAVPITLTNTTSGRSEVYWK